MDEILVICPTTSAMDARLRVAFKMHRLSEGQDGTAWLRRSGPRIRYVLTDGHLGLGPEVLKALPNLRVVSSYGVGYDAIDTGALTARGIPLAHTPGVLDQEVATTALMLMLACLRNLLPNAEHARSGRWAKAGALPLSRTADGRRVGILGLGRIGKAIAAKLAPFDATILYCGRTRQPVDYRYFDDPAALAHEAEILIAAVPGGAATHHLIGHRVLDALGPDGVLVNVGRGSVVDETALIKALQSGRLGGAGLDVFQDEPHISRALRALSNVVLTPHVGSATIETRAAMGTLAIDNLLAFRRDGTLLTPVPESAHLIPKQADGPTRVP